MMRKLLCGLFDDNSIPVIALDDRAVIYANPAACDYFAKSFEGLSCADLGELCDDILRVADGETEILEGILCARFVTCHVTAQGTCRILRIPAQDVVYGAAAEIVNSVDATIRSALSIAMLGLGGLSRYIPVKDKTDASVSLSAVYQGFYRVLRTAGDLGTIARLRMGCEYTKPVNLNVLSYVSEYAEKCATLLESLSVDVHLTYTDGECVFALDEYQFEHLFYALIANALSHRGLKEIHIRLTPQKDYLDLSVSDDGEFDAGASTALHSDPLAPAGERVSHDLPLAAAIAANYSGRVMLSGGGKGNCVTVRLRRMKDAPDVLRGGVVDYSGGLDVARIALSPYLPLEAYKGL